jgi:hypothetical protein
MRPVLLFILLFPVCCFSQVREGKPIDSARYYQRQLYQMQREVLDSLHRTPAHQEASEKYKYFRTHSDGYGSFVLFMEVAQADFEELNAALVPKGYEKMEGPVYRFGFGMSIKTNRTIVDLYMFSAGLRKSSKKTVGGTGNSSVNTVYSNGAILDIGIDLLKSPRFNVYPYAGISMRTCDIFFEAPRQLNTAFTDITDLVVNDQSAEGSSIRLGYQAGMGFEVVTSKLSLGAGGIIFVKAGINRPFGKEKYKIEGVRYDPGIEYGKWIVAAGVKFFGRK